MRYVGFGDKWRMMHPVNHSFNKYVLNDHYVTDSVVDTTDNVLNKTG